MSGSEDNFFSDLDGCSGLFLYDEELNPEDETVVLDGSTALLDYSMPLIHFDDRSVLFSSGLSKIFGHFVVRKGV